MGALLLIPFFLIRFGLLSRLDRSAVRRAAHFPHMEGGEKAAYYIYQLSNAAILLYLFFVKVKLNPPVLFATGAIVYLAGNLLLIFSMIHFARPSEGGVNRTGLYRFSRNPMYVAYFVYFSACALLTQSVSLFAVVLLFQASAHWIILAEERWCIKQFGEEYVQYMKKVRRYI